jgi:hypothetical protein
MDYSNLEFETFTRDLLIHASEMFEVLHRYVALACSHPLWQDPSLWQSLLPVSFVCPRDCSCMCSCSWSSWWVIEPSSVSLSSQRSAPKLVLLCTGQWPYDDHADLGAGFLPACISGAPSSGVPRTMTTFGSCCLSGLASDEGSSLDRPQVISIISYTPYAPS